MTDHGNTPAKGETEFQLGSENIGKRDNKSDVGVVTPRHLLHFGVGVLAVLVCLLVAASWVYLWSDEHHFLVGKEIFEFAKITLPPIATLILGFYFRGSHGAD
jgi:hypothetical protein